MWKTKHLKTHKRLFGFFRGYVYEFTMQSSLTQRKATLEIFTVSSICINRQLQATEMSLVLFQSFFPIFHIHGQTSFIKQKLRLLLIFKVLTSAN